MLTVICFVIDASAGPGLTVYEATTSVVLKWTLPLLALGISVSPPFLTALILGIVLWSVGSYRRKHPRQPLEVRIVPGPTELENLAVLHASGNLSDEEYSAAKARYLGV